MSILYHLRLKEHVLYQIVDKVLNFFVTAHFTDSYVCQYTLRSAKMLVPRI